MPSERESAEQRYIDGLQLSQVFLQRCNRLLQPVGMMPQVMKHLFLLLVSGSLFLEVSLELVLIFLLQVNERVLLFSPFVPEVLDILFLLLSLSICLERRSKLAYNVLHGGDIVLLVVRIALASR